MAADAPTKLHADPSLALLTVAQMSTADRAAMARGTSGRSLMAAAGNAVYEAIVNRLPPQPTVVLCGPGNNGGDGYVVAEKMHRAGWPVHVAALVDPGALRGDAAWAASLWRGTTQPLRGAAALDGSTLVVDALFGAGLARSLDGAALDAVTAIGARDLACVGVDIPSGLQGDTGQVLGNAPPCRLTVTFFRAKPGHLLQPGRTLCGELVLADIGVPGAVLGEIAPLQWRNGPGLWRHCLSRPKPSDHKYSRGHVLILGGAAMTGATRLAATGARRAGAGMVSIAAPPAAAAIYRTGEPGVIVHDCSGVGEFRGLLADSRRNAVLLGPGLGVGEVTQQAVLAALEAGRAVVLDADALTSFADRPEALFAGIRGPCLLTPHEGEFARLFGQLVDPAQDKLARARAAAKHSGATILLKGADTVIAAPDGRAVINDNAPATLATAGAGDVLAGIAAAVLAHGVEPIAAGAAASWLHGAAALAAGPALIAEDLSLALGQAV